MTGRNPKSWLWAVCFGVLFALTGCDSTGRYGATSYFWHKPGLAKGQAFKDLVFCMDLADAAYQRYNENQQPGYGPGWAGALIVVAVHTASSDDAADGALLAYDRCMHDRGYIARTLVKSQKEQLAEIRANVERAEVLSSIMSSPLEPTSVPVPLMETRLPR